MLILRDSMIQLEMTLMKNISSTSFQFNVFKNYTSKVINTGGISLHSLVNGNVIEGAKTFIPLLIAM